ncbi:MAG: methionine--tRNA ligase subunit beta [Deltaproteobacteria bacterium]|nr:methionine--tRNA ligase subunit beta [Deltaproteobacteria bacterium]
MDKVSIEHFKKLNLVVGLVVECSAVAGSKKLLKLRVDLGSFGIRQILAGLKGFYDPDEMVGKKIVVVENLEPAKMMGEESQGMLLAVTSKDSVLILEPSKFCQPGDIIS